MSNFDALPPAGPIQLIPRKAFNQLARTTLIWFILTFMAARGLVLLIMLRMMPDMFLFVGSTHVHHLNYGIFLLSIVAGFLLFVGPEARTLTLCAALYGVAIALTFDEFGMWLHLGGSYWQRGSFDAVVVIAALLSLLVVMPRLRSFKIHHWFFTLLLAGGAVVLLGLFARSVQKFGDRLGPKLMQIEQNGPTL